MKHQRIELHYRFYLRSSKGVGYKAYLQPSIANGSKVDRVIALFNNMRTLKFKAKLTITFYAAVNHYRNGHPKADRNPPITNQERDLLTSLKYRTCFLRGLRRQRKNTFCMMRHELHSSHVIEKRNNASYFSTSK